MPRRWRPWPGPIFPALPTILDSFLPAFTTLAQTLRQKAAAAEEEDWT